MPHIVQAEFFHVGGDAHPSLTSVLQESFKRMVEYASIEAHDDTSRFGIKTCVRFYDTDGAITAYAHLLEKRDAQIRSYEIALESRTLSGLKQWWYNELHRRLVGKRLDARKQTTRMVTQAFRAALKYKRDVCIERADRSFRPVFDNEKHELAEAVSRAVGVWVFVFAPNDIVADNNELVARIM
jgi:hypothetical protein